MTRRPKANLELIFSWSNGQNGDQRPAAATLASLSIPAVVVAASLDETNFEIASGGVISTPIDPPHVRTIGCMFVKANELTSKNPWPKFGSHPSPKPSEAATLAAGSTLSATEVFTR